MNTKDNLEEDGEGGAPGVTTSAIDSSTPRIYKKDAKRYKRKTKQAFKDFYKASTGS